MSSWRSTKSSPKLPVGESFVFINDHDPLPLYYEFARFTATWSDGGICSTAESTG